jgi:hypothetical protein
MQPVWVTAAREDSSTGQGQREYRDADGKVHHHTNTYRDQHGSKRWTAAGASEG